MLLLMIEKDMPIDCVLYADTGMEFPEMEAHIAKLDDLLFRERGIHITTLRHPYGFEWLMFDVPQQQKRAIERRIAMGQPLTGYGWPGMKVRWCTGQLKTHLISKERTTLQDEVRDKSVAFVINIGKTGGRLTADLLRAAMRRYLEQSRHPQAHHGKQTVKQIVEQGAGVQNIEITDKNIKSLERVARKYGVDFALKKDPAEGKYLVFFKSRDADALNAAFAEYTAKTMHRSTPKKPSLLARLSHFKEVAKQMAQDRAKNREKGEMER